jgi:hypothetical protein
MRKSLMAIALTCLLFGVFSATQGRAESDFKVTLLGTGSPLPDPGRFGPSAKEAGIVFSKAKPKLAVYTQVVLLGNATIPPPAVDDLIAETRQTYGGPLELGEDLMSFKIGDTVTVHRFRP